MPDDTGLTATDTPPRSHPATPAADPGTVLPTPRSPGHRRALWLLPPAAMLVLGLWGIGHGWSWDETASISAARRSLPELWVLTQTVDIVHLAYYAFLHVWLLPGGGPTWSHVPTVAASVAAAVVVCALGTRLVDLRAGVVAGVVFATLPVTSFYAQTARSYALVTLAVVVATYCLVRGVETPAPRWWVGYGVAVAVAMVFNELSAPVLLAHLVTLALRRPARPVWTGWLVAAVLGTLPMLPIGLASLHQTEQLNWLSPPTLHTVAVWVGEMFGPAKVVILVLVVLAACGVTVPARQSLRVVDVALPLLVVPPGLLMLVSLVHPLFRDRYVLSSVAGSALLVGAGLDRVIEWVIERVLDRGPTPGQTAPALLGDLVAVTVVVAVALVQLPTLRYDRTPLARANNLQGAAQVIRAQARRGDAVLFTRPQFRGSAIAYPADYAGTVDVSLGRSPTEADNLMGSGKRPAVLRADLQALDRVWVIGLLDRNARQGWGTAVVAQQVLHRSFRLVRTYRESGCRVQLWVRRQPAG